MALPQPKLVQSWPAHSINTCVSRLFQCSNSTTRTLKEKICCLRRLPNNDCLLLKWLPFYLFMGLRCDHIAGSWGSNPQPFAHVSSGVQWCKILSPGRPKLTSFQKASTLTGWLTSGDHSTSRLHAHPMRTSPDTRHSSEQERLLSEDAEKQGYVYRRSPQTLEVELCEKSEEVKSTKRGSFVYRARWLPNVCLLVPLC